jgi:hypothetical protein
VNQNFGRVAECNEASAGLNDLPFQIQIGENGED